MDLWTHGFNYREIATITKRSEGSVRVLVHRALTYLREHPFVRTWLRDESDNGKAAGQAVNYEPLTKSSCHSERSEESRDTRDPSLR